MSIIDVFDRNIIDYHLGLSCKAEDASRILKNAFIKRELTKGGDLPIIRTDNSPQFISKVFGDTCEGYRLNHQRIPVKTPNMNAHIEAFHSILEGECYSWNEFLCYPEVYEIVSEYMMYNNYRRRNGSLKNATPEMYYQQLKYNLIKGVPFTA